MNHFKQLSLSLPNSGLLLFALTFLILNTTFSQVTIRERVEIKPHPKLSFYDCTATLLFRYGGVLILDAPAPPGNNFTLEPGLLDEFPPYGETRAIGTFNQWSGLTYWLQSPDDTIWYKRTFCDNGLGGIVNDYPFPLLFYVCTPPDTCPSYTANVCLNVYMIPDSSRAQFAPQTFLDDWANSGGNPYVSDPEAIIRLPIEGKYRLVIKDGALNGKDDLKLILPNDTTILTSAQSHIGDTLILGPYPAGTQIQFAIISHAAPIVEGMTLYPKAMQLGTTAWEFRSENWTDLNWDDLTFEFEYNAGIADHLELYTIPDVFEYGDTASMMIRAVDVDGNFVPLDSTYQYTITLLDTVGYGYLMYDGWTDNTFTVQGDSGVGKWFQYAATGKIPEDTVVEIPFNLIAINQPVISETKAGRQNIDEENINNDYKDVKSEKYKVNKLHAGKLPGYRIIQTINQPDTLQNDNNIPEKKREILLGETKYYYLKFYENSGQYEIGEDSVPNNSGIAGVQFSVERLPVYKGLPGQKPDGEKMGVYHEYKNSTGTPIENQIRLIGRYWHEESTYVVKLSTKISGVVKRTALIEVKKPRKLGSALDPTVDDVFGHQIMINDTIIKYAGIYGVPPQIIKGQISKETSFKPVYRYEPWKDIEYHKSKKCNQYFGSNLNFIVTKTTIGDGPGIPPNTSHKYVPPLGDYPRDKNTIREYLVDNRYEYIKRNGLIFMNDKQISREWRKHYQEIYKSGVWSDEILLQNEALGMAMDLLSNGTIGRSEYDWTAQTRIMASYGFLQITHFNATDLNLYEFTKISITQPPEFLNDETYNFHAYGERMLIKLEDNVGDNMPIHDWSDGFEKIWLNVLGTYNSGEPAYANEVVSRSLNYLPVKGE